MTNTEAINRKIADIEEQLEIINTGDTVVMIDGGKLSKPEMMTFQQSRIDTLESLLELEYEDILDEAQDLLVSFLAAPSIEKRGTLYLYLIGLGLSSVDELLPLLETE